MIIRIYIFLFLFASCDQNTDYDKSSKLALKSDTLLSQNKLDEAETIITQAISLDSSNHIDYNNLGILRMKRGLPKEQIIESFIKSMTIKPDYGAAIYNLANFYYEIKDYSNSIAFCTKYLVIARNEKEIKNDISRIYTIRSESKNLKFQFFEALVDSDSAIILNPNSFWAYKERGSAYRQLHQYDEAIKNYSKALEINPGYAQAYNGLAICYDDSKIDLNKAIQNYTKAITLDPQSAAFVYNRGACLYDNGFRNKALPDFRKADSLGKPEAKYYLKKYY